MELLGVSKLDPTSRKAYYVPGNYSIAIRILVNLVCPMQVNLPQTILYFSRNNI